MSKVSVLIPNFNHAQWLPMCIENCLQQHYLKEIIVVDDHSSDESWVVLEQFREKYPQLVKIFKNTKKGACAARNLGFAESTGEFIQFLDGDDLLSKDKIEQQLTLLEKNPGCVANGRWGRFYHSVDEQIHWGPDVSLRRDLDPVSWLIQNHMSTVHAWLTPRSIIEKAGPWREDLAVNQDGEFFSRVVLASEKVLYTPGAKAYYRSNLPTSTSAAIQKPKAIASRYKSIELLEQRLLGAEDSARVRTSLADAYKSFVYSYYPKFPELISKAEEKVEAFGGSKLPVPGGELYRVLSRLLGWKVVSEFKNKFGRL